MRLVLFCVDALDPRIVSANNIFNSIKGNKGLVWTQSAKYKKPISSAMSWACMYTGMREEKLKHLTLLPARHKNIKSNTVSDSGSPAIWAALSSLGYRVGVLEGLVTDVESMPKKKGNFILTGVDAPRKWWPEDLDTILPVDRLSYALPYPVGYKTLIGKDLDWEDVDEKELAERMPDYYFGMSEFIKIRNSYFIPAIRSLNQRFNPDFLLVFRYEIDHLSHMQWHEHSKETVIRGYRFIEEFVLDIKEMLKPDHIMVVSDHGMGELVNRYHKHKNINSVNVDTALGNSEVIVSCDHEGPGFYMLSGFENKTVEINMEDIFGIILNIFSDKPLYNRFLL